MKRNSPIVLLILLSLVLLSCNLSTPLTVARVIMNTSEGETETTPEALEPSPEPTEIYDPMLIRVIRSEEGPELDYDIYLEHPELDQAGPAGDQFNQMIEQFMLAQLEYFRKNVSELDDSSKALGKSTYALNYSTYRVDQQFVSLLLVEDVYYAGAVHPARRSYAINFDIGQERFLELADLFIDQSPFILVISQYCAQTISEEYGPDFFRDGVAAIPDNFAAWNVTANGLLITFQEYQVMAYAAGSPQVLVPYEILIDYIDPNGPLGIILPRDERFING